MSSLQYARFRRRYVFLLGAIWVSACGGGSAVNASADSGASGVEIPAPTSAPAPVTGGPVGTAVTIDATKIPLGSAGVGVDQLISTTEQPSASDIGAFRTVCSYTHMAFDDPIVYPGQPGKSHLHTFFGNTGANANSTPSSIAGSGNSTCRGGTINRSAYWVPSMIDTKDGTPLKPMDSNFYYKTGYALPPSVIQPMPAGLRMISGDAKGTPSAPSSAAMFSCVWNGGNGYSSWQTTIPDCPASGTSWLIQNIDFPQCWDGVNLDSPDHKSHMANPIYGSSNNTGRCPATHPIAIPAISFQILYPVTAAGQTKRWRLSSDNYDTTQPAGYSNHGDWFDGWKSEIVSVWLKNCDQAQKDCHSHLLGDGRAMLIP